MGEMRDDLMSKASLAASDTLQRVQRVAEETVSTAKDTAKEEVQKQGLVPDQGGSQGMGGSQGQPNAPRPQGGSPGMSSSQGQTGVVRPQSGSQGMSMGSGQGQSGSQRQGVGGQAVGVHLGVDQQPGRRLVGGFQGQAADLLVVGLEQFGVFWGHGRPSSPGEALTSRRPLPVRERRFMLNR